MENITKKEKTARFSVDKFWVGCQYALTTVSLHVKKAKQLTVSNALSVHT
jgi:hypothetical protein